MPERNGSADSFDEFFGESKIENVTDDEKSKQNDPPTKSTIEALIKSQPVMHQRRTPSQTKGRILFQYIYLSLIVNFFYFNSYNK